MQLLTTLSIIYVVILVLALAASLIAVLFYLRRIAAVLEETRSALGSVSQRTAPLEELIENLDAVASGPVENLEEAERKLKAADEHLEAFVKQVEPADLPR